jgi:hypothetical protein
MWGSGACAKMTRFKGIVMGLVWQGKKRPQL